MSVIYFSVPYLYIFLGPKWKQDVARLGLILLFNVLCICILCVYVQCFTFDIK